MKIEARIEQHGAQGPDPWDDDRGICLPLDHVIGGDELLYGRFTILRRGKKNYGLISWQ